MKKILLAIIAIIITISFLQMKDLKKQHSTQTLIEKIELDTGLKDNIFTRRFLQKTR